MDIIIADIKDILYELAKSDMARAEDELKDLYNKLEDLVEIAEYEAVRKEAGL